MDQREISLKYEKEIDNLINEYKQKVAGIRETYNDDIVDEKVSEETKKLMAKAEEIQQNYITELENHSKSIIKDLKEQGTSQKKWETNEAAILKQLERSNNILEAMVILDGKNEISILNLVDKHKEDKEMLNLIKSKADKTISDNIDSKLQDIEFNSIESQIQRIEGNIRYEKATNRLSDKAIQVANSIGNSYF